jgi:ATP-dependent RNA helicase DeaD
MAPDAMEVAVVCRTDARATALERALKARGAAELGPTVRVLPLEEADRRSTKADVISADVPFDAEALEALHARGGVVLVTVRERSHLHRIAGRAGVALDPLPDTAPRPGAPQRIRDRLRAVLREEDLSAELALIAPLLEELPAAEVAAAAMRMARESSSAASAHDDPVVPSGATGRAGAPPPSAPTWTHLFVGIGKRDGVGPGDLVGAMTGEAGIPGDQVGKIDIRESHSTVEVATPVAAKVIEALNGRTLKGRSLRVDYDRKGRSSGSGGSGGRSSGSGGRKPPRSGRESKGRSSRS